MKDNEKKYHGLFFIVTAIGSGPHPSSSSFDVSV